MTGYNYGIVRNSSEVSAKAVKKYTSAIVIICMLWSFIGYTFTSRYLHGDILGSLFGAIVFVTIIVQIERQIILSINPTRWLYIFRGIIALMMAIIGAIIIDQIIFKDDIELEKRKFIRERVDSELESKTKEINKLINDLETTIKKKEEEKKELINEVTKSPTITTYATESRMRNIKITKTDEITGKPIVDEKTIPVPVTTSQNVPNPKISQIEPINESIKTFIKQKETKQNTLLNIRPQLEKEISSKVGFLDELKVMHSLISDSGVALVVWLIWFFFLLGLEMLVLISKSNEKENDYERTIKHQMELQNRKLELFAKMAEGKN